MQLTKEIFVKLQQSVDFFKTFSNGELLALLKLATTEVFEAEKIIFQEGTRGDKMYIILSGSVRIGRQIGGGKEEVLVVLSPGACFGEMGIIDQSPRSARATAQDGQTVLLSIAESVLSQSNSLIAFKLYRAFSVMLAGRVRESNTKLQEASERSRASSSQLKDFLKKKTKGEGASFEGAMLSHADFSGCFLNHSQFQETNLVKAKLSEAKLKEAHFENVKMSGSSIENVEFIDTQFSHVDFSASRLLQCSFTNCSFSDVNLAGADLSSSMAEALDSSSTKSK